MYVKFQLWGHGHYILALRHAGKLKFGMFVLMYGMNKLSNFSDFVSSSKSFIYSEWGRAISVLEHVLGR